MRKFKEETGYDNKTCSRHCSINGVMGLWQSLACNLSNNKSRKIRLDKQFEPYISSYAVLTCFRNSREQQEIPTEVHQVVTGYRDNNRGQLRGN
jgi:hypothetical protein